MATARSTSSAFSFPWLGKSPTCRRHVGPTAKSRHFWPTWPSRADTNSFPTHFLRRVLPTFSKFSLSTRGTYPENHRTNWYVLNNPFSQVTFLHPSQHNIIVTARRATTRNDDNGNGATDGEVDDDGDGATGDADVDDDDDHGDGATGYDNDDDGDGRQRRRQRRRRRRRGR